MDIISTMKWVNFQLYNYSKSSCLLFSGHHNIGISYYRVNVDARKRQKYYDLTVTPYEDEIAI